MNLIGLINIVCDAMLVLLLVRAVVRNEGHMAFNWPYQRVVTLLDPLLRKLKATERQARPFCLFGMLIVVGLRGLAWMVFGGTELDYKVTSIPIWNRSYLQYQVLSVVAAMVFLLQVYAFVTLAIAIGGLEGRTDHYSRLMRALLGPFKTVPEWWRCALPALALILFWSVGLWTLSWLDLHPAHRHGIVGCVLSSIPITIGLIVDLARVWIGLLIVRCVFSFFTAFLPIRKPICLDLVDWLTDPALKPFRRLPLKAGQFDFTPVVAILALAIVHHLLLGQPIQPLNGVPLLRWFFLRSFYEG